MKKLILIGRSEAGKTTLIQALRGEKIEYKKTQYVNNFDDYCYANGVELYSAQKSTVQASVNNLNINDSTLIVGEMGIGIIQF